MTVLRHSVTVVALEPHRIEELAGLILDFAESTREKGGRESGGNFANDPQRAAEAGQKGGRESGGGRQ